jgi:hypothetical protein
MSLGNMALKVRSHSVRWQHRLTLNAINHGISRVIHEQHARLIANCHTLCQFATKLFTVLRCWVSLGIHAMFKALIVFCWLVGARWYSVKRHHFFA